MSRTPRIARSFRIATSLIVGALCAAACNPSRPTAGDGDGGLIDAPPEPIDAPGPGTAMETVVGAGHVTSQTMVLDVQLGGGLPGAATTTTETLRPAPALP